MTVHEQYPDIQTLKRYHGKILFTRVVSRDPVVGTICDKADQLTNCVNEIDISRTRELAGVLAKAELLADMISPEYVLAVRHELEQATDETQRGQIQEALAELEDMHKKERDRFEAVFFPVSKRIRDASYSISQSIIADHIIEAFTQKRAILDQLVKLSQESLTPLIQDLTAQIKAVDASMSKEFDKNFFDHALTLLPSEEAVTGLTKKASATPDPDAPKDKPAAPETNKDALTVPVVAYENAAVKGGSTAALSAAVPEEAALKLAYEGVKNALGLLRDGTELYKKIGEHAQLWDRLAELKEKYNQVLSQQEEVSRELDNLDQLSQHLNQIGLYLEESEKLDITLCAYVNALRSAHQEPEAYYRLLRGLCGYLRKLNLAER